MDIALRLGQGADTADIAFVGGVIDTDGTLYTSVLLSLLCDRLADVDDVIPDASTNRRGYWYDAFLPPLPDGTPDRWGSKIWLRLRSLITAQLLLQLQTDCEQALAWMIATGVAFDVEATATQVSDSAVAISIVISRYNAGGAPYAETFGLLWDRTLGLNVTSTPSGTVSQSPPVLAVGASLGISRSGVIPPPGIVYTNGESLGDATIGAGLVWLPATATLQIGQLGWANLPAQAQHVAFPMSIAGPPAAGRRYLFSLPQQYTIPANFAGAVAIQDVACTDNAVFEISIISGGVETGLGTITLLPEGGTMCTFSEQAAFTNSIADALVLTTPAEADATLSGVGISLLMQRV